MENELLDELFELTQMEETFELNEMQKQRYVELYDELCATGVEIPFGVEI